MRLKEAAKLGFASALAPTPASADPSPGVKLTGVARLADAVQRIGEARW
jgi:predicted ATP-dependent serine protease